MPLGLFALLVQRRVRSWWLLLPLAVSPGRWCTRPGIHATVAGVLLGFAVPVVRSERAGGPDAGPGLAEHFEHRFRPLSAGVAVPVFAFFSAGRRPSAGSPGCGAALTDPVALGIVVGLVRRQADRHHRRRPGWCARFTRADLDDGLAWIDVLGLAVLAGIGFTVSLLIGELAFGDRQRARRPRQGRRARPARSSPPSWRRRPAARATAPTAGWPPRNAPTTTRDGIPDVYQSRDTT